MLSVLFSFLSSMFSEVLSNVLSDALSTPAVTTSIEETAAPLPTIATPADELLNQFGGLLDRG